MGNGYAVDTGSAEGVAAATEEKIGDLDSLKTSLTEPLANAQSSLPDGFAAIARLKTLQTDHKTDVATIKTYATSCVTGLRSCLAIYENTSAEMVAEQKATESKVQFEHDGLLDYAAQPVNDKIDSAEKKHIDPHMPERNEGTGKDYKYEQTVSNGGQNTTVAKEYSQTSNGGTTGKSMQSVASTHNGVTDTTAYHSNTSGGTTTTSQSYAVSSGGTEHYRVETGPVAR